MEDMENLNVMKEFSNKYYDEMRKWGHVNLIIAGKTGVGKSTLLNAALGGNLVKTGIGRPITDLGDGKWYEKDGVPLRIMDTVGLELDAEKRRRSLKAIKNEIKNNRKKDEAYAMWYCVSCESDRLESFEAEYINEISEDISVILVITKAFRIKHAEKLINAIKDNYPGLKVSNIIKVLAQDEDPEDCDEGVIPKKKFGVSDLCEATNQILPKELQNAWCSVQKGSIDLKIKNANRIVNATAASCFTIGFIPIPFADAPALVAAQIGMMAKITSIFGISLTDHFFRTTITSLLGTSTVTVTGKTIVTGLLKFVPGVNIVTGAISGTTAGILTAALGKAYIEIMIKVEKGEIEERNLASKNVQNQLNQIFKNKLQIEKKSHS